MKVNVASKLTVFSSNIPNTLSNRRLNISQYNHDTFTKFYGTSEVI